MGMLLLIVCLLIVVDGVLEPGTPLLRPWAVRRRWDSSRRSRRAPHHGGRSVILRHAALIVVSVATLALPGPTAAAQETTDVVRSHLEQIVAVRDVQAEPDQVSGVLLNLSSKVVHDVRVLIDRSWLWADER